MHLPSRKKGVISPVPGRKMKWSHSNLVLKVDHCPSFEKISQRVQGTSTASKKGWK